MPEKMSDSESEISDDSDNELQEAFQKKEIQGLVRLVPHKKRIVINNIIGMQEKLKEMRMNLPWIERLDTFNEPAPLAPELVERMQVEKTSTGFVEDEFKREITFYRQAQAAVLEAIPKLNALNVKTRRPNDYFAQMAKSDEHMQKIRELLLNKQTVMERKEKLKKLREMKKYGKQVQREVLQKRQEEKKEMMESVKKFRKSQKNKSDDLDFETKSTNTNKQKSNKLKKTNKKALSRQEFKDKKFGFGGQKKKSKFNTKESTNDIYGGVRRRTKGNNKNFGGRKKGGKGRKKSR